ncbi:MAG: hypothetical protein CM1200mP4_1970 [Rhodospirillaceae bacterium]|nr:MAG: hypothetical protein CM1200mP4_1970 [Rhodospirillaceae bacterium]
MPLQTSLRALGYTDILRVPTKIIEELVLPTLSTSMLRKLLPDKNVNQKRSQAGESNADSIEPGMLEFLVERRFMNGSATMLIDLDNCVRCDECVVACANAQIIILALIDTAHVTTTIWWLMPACIAQILYA